MPDPAAAAEAKPTRSIASVAARRVLNSHVQFTNEFILELEDGSVGVGASPQGETISIYEDRKTPSDVHWIIDAIRTDDRLCVPLRQEDLDAYLAENQAAFGRNNCYAISLAFHNALGAPGASGPRTSWLPEERPLRAPHLCCNILNGGWHAYTNSVLSDFPEYLLVSRSNDIEEVVGAHNDVQAVVTEALAGMPKATVGGNPVSRFRTADNRECLEFLLNVCGRLGLADAFDLMIDASAGDLWSEGAYRLAVTEGPRLQSDELCQYWLDLIRQYGLRFLEDPFGEVDFAAWTALTASQEGCLIVGDNFYSSDARRIEEGAAGRCTHGVIVKPNQAGTVTAVRAAIETAQRLGQVPITSHRSISTESPFEATLTCVHGVEYMKIGPLMTDYSSVIRLNEIIRLTEESR